MLLISFLFLTGTYFYDSIYAMLALFKSHYSIGKSILTLDDPITHKEGGSDSVFTIAKENNLETVVLVEDSLTGFLQAKKISEKYGINLAFGLRINMKENAGEDPKQEASSSSHKIIIFAKTSKGCKILNNIYSEAFSKNFNSVDEKILKKLWKKRDLELAIPFYDSFIFNNTMKFSNCTPSFSFTDPYFITESNGLPFDAMLEERVKNYARDKQKIIKAKSIYYKNKEDVKALQTYKCICGRTFGNKTLSKPNLDHFGSDQFSFESWKEKK